MTADSEARGCEMNDNDIVKALEHCVKLGSCAACPYWSCCGELPRDSFDLINRQKAEIERLEAYNANLEAANSHITNTLWDEVVKAKTEAIKEFAERLKQMRVNLCSIEMVAVGDIDAIVEEMTEE